MHVHLFPPFHNFIFRLPNISFTQSTFSAFPVSMLFQHVVVLQQRKILLIRFLCSFDSFGTIVKVVLRLVLPCAIISTQHYVGWREGTCHCHGALTVKYDQGLGYSCLWDCHLLWVKFPDFEEISPSGLETTLLHLNVVPWQFPK